MGPLKAVICLVSVFFKADTSGTESDPVCVSEMMYCSKTLQGK